jgi:membrane protein DedA with SNARE-associated domain
MLELLQQYQYIFLFIGVIIGGETVIVPAVYLVLTKIFNLGFFLSITIVATVISDTAWYLFGRYVPWEKMNRYRAISKRKELLSKFGVRFDRRALWYLYISKFVYGTRILAQVLSGLRRIPYWKYILVNTLAILSWITLIFLLGLGVYSGFGAYKQRVGDLQIFTFFVAVFVLISIWISNKIKKNW